MTCPIQSPCLEPQDWLDSFLSHLEDEKRASVHTLESYAHALHMFSAAHPGKQWNGLILTDFRAYLYRLSTQQKLSISSIRLHFAALRAFYRFLGKRGLVAENPIHALKMPAQKPRLPKFLTEEQMQSLMQTPEKVEAQAARKTLASAKRRVGRPVADWQVKRDVAILEVLYSTGMRISEVVNMRWNDLQREALRVMGKGKKERIVLLGELALVALKAYREALPLKFQGNESVFVNFSGKRISPRAIQQSFKKYLASAGLDHHLSPHKVRHSFATHMLDRGAHIRAIQALLGHANLQTTQIYTRVTTDRLRRSYQAAHPRA